MFENKSVLEDDDTLTVKADPEDSGSVSPVEGSEEEPTRPYAAPTSRDDPEPQRY